MLLNKNKSKSNFVKAKTSEGRKKQKQAIINYYLNKKKDSKKP